MPHIIKIGLAVLDEHRVLLVRKRGSDLYILPGGKPEGNEDDLTALRREIDEELGCRLSEAGLEYLGEFTDRVAGTATTTVTVRLYVGLLSGPPRPMSEIEELQWFSPSDRVTNRVAPSLENQILPYLFEAMPRLSAGRRTGSKAFDHA
ncbi:NUDIX hydrolase [Bosea vaviloviae]|uniref:Nudix hydrolase domain-containing protein n=1 Tax=Bosea vaviloviae TaxID=1526658 RepID=A0A0N1N3T3_9HYPH|nr:NUDIX domain-containing protein [Bosea vaviloviae]KPH82735.1 hypothetical protein AE618_02210 [Bosea vaviloviae]